MELTVRVTVVHVTAHIAAGHVAVHVTAHAAATMMATATTMMMMTFAVMTMRSACGCCRSRASGRTTRVRVLREDKTTKAQYED